MKSTACTPLIGITSGDEAGIGPEVIIKTLTRRKVSGARFVLYGSTNVFDSVAAGLHIEFPYRRIESLDEIGCDRRIWLLHCPRHDIKKIIPGRTTVYTAGNAFGYIARAAADALAGKIDAMVTAPISKISMHKAGIDIPGHTDYLARLSRTKNFAMMFVGGGLKVVLATIHTPLKTVPQLITRQNLREKILLSHSTLRNLFKIRKPKIAVCGLNPHAGEGGMLGQEELKTVIPAIKQLRQRGINVVGPYPADTVFNRALEGEFDLVLTMYHDQGLIPIKLLAFDTAVNMTIGLPFIRTSPDHGTAFDIAGKGLASPNSFAAALALAIKLARK